jgi:hypothetical protein
VRDDAHCEAFVGGRLEVRVDRRGFVWVEIHRDHGQPTGEPLAATGLDEGMLLTVVQLLQRARRTLLEQVA